jgi:hypothetical protein
MAGMKKMKILGLLLVFILSIVLVSGCSQAEMGFVNLMNEVNSMDAYEGSETVNLKINKLPSDLTKSDPVTVAAVQSMLSTYSLRSDVRMDAGREVFDGTIYLVNNDTGAETQVFSFVAAGGTVYLKVDDLLSFAKLLNNQQLNKQLALLDGVQYISISSAEVEEAMSASGQPGYDVFNIKKQQALYRKMMDGLTQEAYADYETGMVQQDGNKYTLTVDKQAVIDNIQPFLEYSINNADTISSFAKCFLQGLDAEELAMLSLTPEMRAMAIDGMTTAVNDIANNRDKYLAQVEALPAAAEEAMSIIGDKTGITIEIEKLGEEHFVNNTQFAFEITNPENPADKIDIEIESTAEYKGIDSFEVTVPDSGIMSITELLSKMPQVMIIDTTNEKYTVQQGIKTTSGSIDIRMIKGRIYLPVRTVGNAMNENVGWDPVAKQAYVIKDGKTINLASSIFDGSAFVKIRDFEKLGYTVNWNSATKTALITQ